MDCPICNEVLLEELVPSQYRNVDRHRCKRCGDFETDKYTLTDPQTKRGLVSC